jgi:uncharacterized protein
VAGDGASSAAGGPRRRRRATTDVARPPRRRAPATAALTERRRRVTALGGGTAALLAAAAGGATWYYAERITERPGVRSSPPLADDAATVVALDEHEVVLTGPAASRPGWWGVVGHDGWCLTGPPDATDGDEVRRPATHHLGTIAPGAAVRLDPEAIPEDPAALGWPVEELTVAGPLGDLPAWWFPAPPRPDGRRPVAILVHGRSGSRREAARWIPAFLAAGVSCLAISYRNAPGAPSSPDGRSHLGATEWEDVAAALVTARGRGASHLILFGASMGGACIGELLRRTTDTVDVHAVVLDAPVRHWGPVLRAAAHQRGLPRAVLPLLLPPTMALAGARGRIDWGGLAHLDDPFVYALPTLLFHGDADATVPVALSDAFATARPDVVTYHRVAGAGHLQSWNVDREGCERALAAFLGRVLAAT